MVLFYREIGTVVVARQQTVVALLVVVALREEVMDSVAVIALR